MFDKIKINIYYTSSTILIIKNKIINQILVQTKVVKQF